MSERITPKDNFDDVSVKVDAAKLKKYQEENYRLKTLLKEAKLKSDMANAERENELLRQADEIVRLKTENTDLKALLREKETESKELTHKLVTFQKALKTQIRSKSASAKDDIIQEIEQIDDPYALVVINKLMFGPQLPQGPQILQNTSQNTQSFKTELESAKYQIEQEHKQTLRKLTLLNEEAHKELKTLKEQNAFLLSQLDFAEKQLETKGVKPDFGHTKKENTALKSEICRIFQLGPDDDVIDCLVKIERGYQYVPMMQETLEQVYTILTENDVLPVMCTSKNQMIEILENWAANLNDYQNLVKTLFEVMGITNPNFKSRTYLVESIRKLISTRQFDGTESEPSVRSQESPSKVKA